MWIAGVVSACIAIAVLLLVDGSEPDDQAAKPGRAIVFVAPSRGAARANADRDPAPAPAVADPKHAIAVASGRADPAVEATLSRYLHQDIVASRQRALARQARSASAPAAMAGP